MFNFVNRNNMPNYLNTTDFNVWHQSFFDLCNGISLTTLYFMHDLEIEFSDELKTRNYGSYSIDEIKEKIGEKWNINDEIEGILNRINSSGDYQRGEYGCLAAAIQDNNPNTDYNHIKTEVDEWFDNITFCSPVLGEYINYQKRIVYTNNIESDCHAGNLHNVSDC